MKGILRRTVHSGPGTAVNRGLKRMIRRRARVLAMCVVVSLLAASLPASSANTQGLQASNGSAQSISLPAQLYRGVSQSLASIGTWMASVFTSTSPKTIAYQPVAAYISPAPPFIDAPTNLSVTAASASSISLSWTAPGGSVDHYQIERAANIEGPFFFLTNVTGATTHADNTVTNLHAYLYRVRAVTSVGLPSAPSNMALGTAISFQFNELDGQLIKAQNFSDVRAAINLVRAVGNLSAATWERNSLVGLHVLASDVNEMRTRLNEALTALSIPVTAYQDPTLQTGANGTWIHSTHLEQLQTRATKGSSTSFGPIDSDSSTARLDPLNETGGGGENPLSRNFNWNLPLVGLPGRAGLDLGLSLAYNSLVWTKSGNTISFDDDNGFPAPGFRLGFPVIQQLYYNTEVGKQAFLLISPDGSRTELRQVGSSDLYEAADSSYLLLDAASMVLRTSDGTQMSYVLMGSEFNCTQIKDRNGNYITINYTVAGRIDTVVDTLARTIKFNYDVNGWLTSITQIWNQGQPSEVTHNWARFEYANVSIDYNFTGLTVFGPTDNSTLKMLSRVKLADDSYFDFSYTSWGQVWKVSSFASDNHLLNHRSYNLPQTGGTAHTDCPRFTERRDWAQYWNGDTNGTTASNEEAVTTFAVPVSDMWTMPDSSPQTGTRAQVTTPDGTSNKIYFIGTAATSSGWRRSLPALVNTYDSGSTLQRQVMTTWTQDNTSVSYKLNPRVTETNAYDPAGNRARTETTYQQFTFANGTSCQLPRDFYEYAANATTKLRSTRTDYNTSTTYTDRRIIGLMSETRLYDGDVNSGGVLMSEVAFSYDESGSIQGTGAPVQHDNTNYTASFVAGRANLSSMKRHDVTSSAFTTISSKYNTSGAVVSSKDALNHEVLFSYADSFSDNNNSRNTLAYPTTVTDPDGYSTTSKYHFDFGNVTYTRTPLPNVITNTAGPEQTFDFDTIGRLLKITNLINNAYTEFEYSSSQIRIDSFSTIQAGQGEARSFRITDGHGRLIARAMDQPGSSGGYSGQKMVYDVMGRLIKTSNPTETNTSGAPPQWTTAGDDATAGWIYTEQTYDWRGRPLVNTSQDGTTKTASYAGCGCAGGEVVTLTDEGTIDGGVVKRRQQQIFSDVLGRIVKTKILNWEGGSVHSTTVSTYNARDQVTQIRQYSGGEESSSFQDTTMTYDGFARLNTRHVPEQQVDLNNPNSSNHTTWTYNADDTVNTITDARGAITTFGYAGTNRGLVKTITRSMSGLPDSNTSFSYDSVGNRLSMSDSSGTTNYVYNQLSQITSETRTFAGKPGSFTLTYGGYNLGGSLLSLTDPFGGQATYQYDSTGRLSSIGASGYTASYFDQGSQQQISTPLSQFASAFTYRAWGATKQATFGNGVNETFLYNSKLAITRYDVNNMRQIFPANPSLTMSWTYDYYNDGRLNHAFHLSDPTFDRKHDYGPKGDIAETYTNREARGLAYSSSDPDPYRQSIDYDVWGNITSRTGRLYNLAQSDTATYTNNRRDGITHDAQGNPGVDFHTFDGANNQIAYTSSENVGGCCGFPSQPSFEITQTYDGLGLPASNRQILRTQVWVDGENGPELQAVNTVDESIYLVRSTVLGGAVIAELIPGAGGQLVKSRVNIYANGKRIAKEENSVINFEHNNPVIGSNMDIGAHSNDRTIKEVRELDPFGAYIPGSDPLNSTDYFTLGAGRPFQESGNPFDIVDGCTLDQVPISCSFLNRLTMAGGVQTQYSGQYRRRTYYDPGDSERHVRTEPVTRDVIYHGIGIFEIWLPSMLRGEGRSGGPEFVVLANHAQVLPRTPCHIMADIAQEVANDAIAAADSVPNATPEERSINALAQFDHNFSLLYHGPRLNSYENMKIAAPGTGRALPDEQGRYIGGEGFQPRYQDSGPVLPPPGQHINGPTADQTHHFSAHLSLGINRRKLANAWRNLFDNQGDASLGQAAYEIGRKLSGAAERGNVVGLRRIGDYIRQRICHSRGRGLDPGDWAVIRRSLL